MVDSRVRLALCEMQTASSRFWTQVAVSIFYDDILYTTSAFKINLCKQDQ